MGNKSIKYISKVLKKPLKSHKYIWKAFEEMLEGPADFLEDFNKAIFKKEKAKRVLRKINFYGTPVLVKPAYVFAEKVENLIKVIFGVSILLSAVFASFWGYTRTYELLAALIGSTIGRVFMAIIGLSYLIIGVWKILRLNERM